MWVRDLPDLMAPSQPKTPSRPDVRSKVSVSPGHSLAAAPPSRHPSVRPSLTRNTFRGVPDYDGHGDLVLPALGLVPEEGENGEWRQKPRAQVGHQELDVARSPPPSEWSTSNWRKYRVKGKGTTSSADPIEASGLLGGASERLARELSCQARPARAPIQIAGSPVPRSHALDIEPIFQAPYDPVFVERSESLASTSQALASEVSSLTRSTVTRRTSRSKAAFGRGSNVATRITRSDRRNSNLHSSSACPTSVSKMTVESGPPPPPPKQRRKLSNYVRTRKDKFSVPRPVRDLTNPDDDAEVRNESEADNCEDEFFDVDSGSYNGPRSTKTMSKRSCSTGSFATRGSVDSGNIAWVYK
ncbi:hypothetical protein BC827DRAFT_1245618 [Russula dissimulans]|nr:hypothetical protein BC827DRAFT_1245618 [Russula dissimulans]